jgi:hypothetical protein
MGLINLIPNPPRDGNQVRKYNDAHFIPKVLESKNRERDTTGHRHRFIRGAHRESQRQW